MVTRNRILTITVGMLILVACQNDASFRGVQKKQIPAKTDSDSKFVVASIESNPEMLMIKAFIGADTFSADPCKSPPAVHSNVSMQLLPVDYCLTGASAAEPTTKICMLVNDVDTIPGVDHACWKSKGSVDQIALLNIGNNYVRFFAIDSQGNMADDGGTVNFKQGVAPLIDLLLPVVSEIAYTAWTAGGVHLVKFKVTDDDTKFEDLRIIISLVDVSNPSKFKHLACNFKNTPAFKQCPASNIENSTLITKDIASKTFSMNYSVPADFDAPLKYVISITAIDQSGNASVATTQPINAGYEVLAGRSYKGFGGSGSTIETPSDTGKIYVDKKKTIYFPNINIKIDPFDSRTCRMFLKSAADQSVNDCRDAFYVPFRISMTNWAYNSKKDVFYATGTSDNGQRNIIKIDFTSRSATAIFAVDATSKNLLNDQVLSNTSASALHLGLPSPNSELGSNLWFIESKQRLVFRFENQLYSLNENDQVKFVLGSNSGQTAWPLNQSSITHDKASIPQGDYPFAVSDDGRIVFSGLKLAVEREGSGYGIQYILDGFDLENIASTINFNLMTDPESRQYVPQFSYDSMTNTFFSTLSWRGAYSMRLPALGAAIDSYKWDVLSKYNPSLPDSSLGDLLASDEKSDGSFIAAPRASHHYATGIVSALSGYLFITERRNGLVFSYNLKTNRMTRIVGFRVGSEDDQLGINRRLTYPRYLSMDANGDLVFSDHYNLQLLKLSAMNGSLPFVTTLIKNFAGNPVILNAATKELIQHTATGFAKYNYLSLAAGAISYTGYNYQGDYVTGFGFSNDLTKLKIALIGSMWDGHKVKEAFSIENNFGSTSPPPPIDASTLMSQPDLISMDYTTYDQTTSSIYPAPPSRSDNIYPASSFRMPAVANFIKEGTGSKLVYTPGDQSYIGCAIDPGTKAYRFAEFDLVGKNVYMFDVFSGGKSIGPCSMVYDQYHVANGVVYLGSETNREVYALDISNIRTSSKALGVAVPIEGQFSRDGFNGFYVDSSYVYYTNYTGVIIRNKRK